MAPLRQMILTIWGNRRVKTVGELIQNKLRVGLRRMERVVKERMSIRESDSVTPVLTG